MHTIEAFADAIMTFEGWHYGTRSWRNRNPGNLRDSYFPHVIDKDGYCIFEDLCDGWAALLGDLKAKFNGSHGLMPTSTILDLLNIYAPAGDHNNPSEYTKFVCSWVSNITGKVITPKTSLYAIQINLPIVIDTKQKL